MTWLAHCSSFGCFIRLGDDFLNATCRLVAFTGLSSGVWYWYSKCARASRSRPSERLARAYSTSCAIGRDKLSISVSVRKQSAVIALDFPRLISVSCKNLCGSEVLFLRRHARTLTFYFSRSVCIASDCIGNYSCVPFNPEVVSC